MTQTTNQIILYGVPPANLLPDLDLSDAVQTSPFITGAARLEDIAAASASKVVIWAPENTIARRYVLGLGLKALCDNGELIVFAPKDKGGSRLKKELQTLGCMVREESRQHMRICQTTRPADLALAENYIADGAPIFYEEAQLWTQPGVFSWDRIDTGSALLLTHMPEDLQSVFTGHGADFGCGTGLLARTLLLSCPQIASMLLVDIDRRGLDCAQRNIPDARARFLWGDVRHADLPSNVLDFVIMNPPFHDGGREDRALGQAFITRAATALRKGGQCWMVANRHLPYEDAITKNFTKADLIAQEHGYKIYHLIR